MKISGKYNLFHILGVALIIVSIINIVTVTGYQKHHGKIVAKKKVKVQCLKVADTCRKVLDHSLLDRSLQLGTDYLKNNQRKEGNFVYANNWIKGTESSGDNEVAQASALWGLSIIFNSTGDMTLLPCLNKGLLFFKNNSRSSKDNRIWVTYPGSRKGRTGTTALAALAVIETLKKEERLDPVTKKDLEKLLDGYLKFIRSLRTGRGNFYSSYLAVDGTGFDRPSPYYDGEVLLALVSARKYAKKNIPIKEIIASADAMYNRYVVEPMKEDPDPSDARRFYQWGVMAFSEIDKSGWNNDSTFANRILFLTDWMIDDHCTLQRSNNISYAIEGFLYAIEIARKTGDDARGKKYACAVDNGLYRVTAWQIGVPIQNKFIRKNITFDSRFQGGIMSKGMDHTLKINQMLHQMHAVILARELLYKK